MAPKKPKKPAKKMGRPPKITEAVLEQARALMAPPRSLSVEEAAAELRVGKTQLYARLGVQTAAGSAPPPSPASNVSTSPVVAPAPASVAVQPDPEALREEGRREARALDDRILGARNPAAARELVDGRVVVAQGEQALQAWLARPSTRAEDVDPLEACLAALAAAVEQAEKLPPLHTKTATVLGVVATLAGRVERIAQGRPRTPTKDEVTERIEARRDDAVRLIERYVVEAAA